MSNDPYMDEIRRKQSRRFIRGFPQPVLDFPDDDRGPEKRDTENDLTGTDIPDGAGQ
jgi:hypothetical protein